MGRFTIILTLSLFSIYSLHRCIYIIYIYIYIIYIYVYFIKLDCCCCFNRMMKPVLCDHVSYGWIYEKDGQTPSRMLMCRTDGETEKSCHLVDLQFPALQ